MLSHKRPINISVYFQIAIYACCYCLFSHKIKMLAGKMYFICVCGCVCCEMSLFSAQKKITKNKSNGMPGRWQWVNIHHASFVV